MTPNWPAFLLGGVVMATSTGQVRACGMDLHELARWAVSDDPQVAQAAISRLRDAGPPGLEAAIEAGAPAAVLDAVGAQRDNDCARLYWYTDLDKAMAASTETGKPILSLRLLGRLDDDLSCANSRYFRTVLYADRFDGDLLRRRFILHWESVRPVPRITIDFGDGRSIVRTITGNSVHYALDEKGRPLDALPGLCGAKAFGQWLANVEALHATARAADQSQRARILRRYHARQLDSVVASWRQDLLDTGAAGTALVMLAGAAPAPDGAWPDAIAAAPIAVSKMAVELPILEATASGTMAAAYEKTTSEAAWQAIAALHLDGALLDDGSLALMARKAGPGRLSAAMTDNFQRSIALDTVRNEYLYHRRIHQWFLDGRVDQLDRLNRRVYAELFLTPDQDPWLGLLPAETYAALDGGGLVCR